jgi:hypothetical protein
MCATLQVPREAGDAFAVERLDRVVIDSGETQAVCAECRCLPW